MITQNRDLRQVPGVRTSQVQVFLRKWEAVGSCPPSSPSPPLYAALRRGRGVKKSVLWRRRSRRHKNNPHTLRIQQALDAVLTEGYNNVIFFKNLRVL
jgi:hypothetical protein